MIELKLADNWCIDCKDDLKYHELVSDDDPPNYYCTGKNCQSDPDYPGSWCFMGEEYKDDQT